MTATASARKSGGSVDKSIERSRQRAVFRRELIDAGSASQINIARERGKQRRSVEKVKTQQRVIERQQSEAARVNAYQQRSDIAIAQKRAQAIQRVETQDQLNALARRERVITSAQNTVTRSSIWSTVVLLISLFFGMIILYVLVTNGETFGRVAGTAGTWIKGLSSNEPLFVKRS